MTNHVTIKEKLRAGKAVSVVSGLPTPDLIDYLGPYGLDGIWIECEHGPTSWEQIGDFSRAADLWGMASVVRIPTGEPWVITRTLDRGASGIVVPHVNTKEQAERIVQAAKFAPLGQRGMFGGRRAYGVSDYYNVANDETLIVVLIEEMEAIENLAEILTVEGVDVFQVAPSDLAQSMGHIGNQGHPDVQATIERAIRQIIDAGRIAGTVTRDESRERFLAMGVQFMYTSWLQWVAKGARLMHQDLADFNARH